VPERRPNRVMGGVHDQFWQFCGKCELRLQQCGACKAYAWPPVDTCGKCGGLKLQWTSLAGTGQLVSWGTFEYKYLDELPLPWETILVELSEGPLFISNPVGFSRGEMVPSLAVEVDFLHCEDDYGTFFLPVFRKSLH
jgi:uncharacterized protein